MIAIGLSLLAFFSSWWLNRYGIQPHSLLYQADIPNHRSLHEHITPRNGGIGIMFGFVASLILGAVWLDWPIGWQWALAFGLLLITAWIDDHGHIPAIWRLCIQLLAAALVVEAGFWPAELHLPGIVFQAPVWLLVTGFVLFIVWMTNLYNFMDGMDGFAGSMSLFGFSVMAIVSFEQDYAFAMLNALLASACAGFLIWNWPRAKIFMGDVGSTLLGFLAAVFVLYAASHGIMHIWQGLLLFSVFIVDASFTLLYRLYRGEKLWHAHQDHLYQRLARRYSVRICLKWHVFVMFLASISIVFSIGAMPWVQWAIIIVWLIYFFAALIFLRPLWQHNS